MLLLHLLPRDITQSSLYSSLNLHIRRGTRRNSSSSSSKSIFDKIEILFFSIIEVDVRCTPEMISSSSRNLHLRCLMLREGALLVAQITVGHAQGRPVEVPCVGVREMYGHVALARNNGYNCHLAVQADSDSGPLLGILKLGQQSPLQRLVGIVLIVNLLGEDLNLRHRLLSLPSDLPSARPLLQQPQNRSQHAPHPFRGRGTFARHLQIVQIIVQLVLVIEHVAHSGGGHLCSAPCLVRGRHSVEPVLNTIFLFPFPFLSLFLSPFHDSMFTGTRGKTRTLLLLSFFEKACVFYVYVSWFETRRRLEKSVCAFWVGLERNASERMMP